MRYFSSLFLILILKTVAFSSGSDTVRILWLGSSSTYCHDLPQQTAQWLETHFSPRPVRSYLVGKSGTGYHEYLQPDFKAQYGLKPGQTLLEKIRDEKYDFVVLQVITYFIGADLKEETEESTDILVEAIRAAGGEPVYFEMGWRTGPENEIGRQLIQASAQKNNIKYYAPASTAWKKVRAENENLELFNLPDSDHPGTLGTFLNLSSLFTAFTGEKFKGDDQEIFVWPRFGTFDKKEAAERVKMAQLDDYHARMPDWMQNISILGSNQKIDRKTAKYLHGVAYETHQNISSKL